MNGRNSKRSGYRLTRPFRWLRALHLPGMCECASVNNADTNERRGHTHENHHTHSNRTEEASACERRRPTAKAKNIYIAISVFFFCRRAIESESVCRLRRRSSFMEIWKRDTLSLSLLPNRCELCCSVGEGDLTGNA